MTFRRTVVSIISIAIVNLTFMQGVQAEHSKINSQKTLTFNLESELTNVMDYPVVPDPYYDGPQWIREGHQSTIDAARAKKLELQPYNNTTGIITPIAGQTDPYTIPGKTIRYISNANPSSLTDNVWGDNEQIVYVTGTTYMQDLTILPGTMVLVAAHQNETNGKACTQTDLNVLKSYESDPRSGGALQSRLKPWYTETGKEEGYYYKRHTDISINGTLIAHGTVENPILICSDANPTDQNRPTTPYDFYALGIDQGILDYTMILDTDFVAITKYNSLTARSLFDNHLESGRNGAGWIVACYFGNTQNEDIGVKSPGSTIIMYNTFENNWFNNIAVGNIQPIDECMIRFNYFSNKGARNIDIMGMYTGTGNNINIKYNEIAGNVGLWSTADVNAPNNYWTTGNPPQQINDRYDNPESNYGRFEYQPEFTGSPYLIQGRTGTEDSDRDENPDWHEILKGSNPDDETSKLPSTNFASLAALISAIIIIAVIRNRKPILHKGNLN